MHEFNTYEYVVAKKAKGRHALSKAALLIGYVIYVVVAFVIMMKTRLGAPLFAFVPLSTWIIVFFTWRYVNVECEYSITSGVLTFSKIYGGRKREEKLSFSLGKCILIAPMSDKQYSERPDVVNADKVYDALSRPDAPDAYIALFEGERGEKNVFLFEATARALSICRFYNSSATVVKKTER